MTIPVFFSPLCCAKADSFSPSAGKPCLAVAEWGRKRLDIDVLQTLPATRDHLKYAHKAGYVDGVLDNKIANGFGNTDKSVAQSVLYTVGAMMAATKYAAERKLRGVVSAACAPVSGFHHAHHSAASGFCTFNGLIVAAMHVFQSTPIKRVAILDYDYHFGDGTEDIIESLDLGPRIFHFTAGQHFRSESSASRMLKGISDVIEQAQMFGAELVIYQAGADQHVDDPLGGLLTTKQLQERDKLVFTECRKRSLPVVWNLAGGYQSGNDGSYQPVLDIHNNTMKECIYAYS